MSALRFKLLQSHPISMLRGTQCGPSRQSVQLPVSKIVTLIPAFRQCISVPDVTVRETYPSWRSLPPRWPAVASKDALPHWPVPRFILDQASSWNDTSLVLPLLPLLLRWTLFSDTEAK